MTASPAFKISKNIHSLLVESNYDDQYVFLLQHFWKMKKLPEKKLKKLVLTECKICSSKRKKLTWKFSFPK